jgi:formylglycine-generating enzyme required for sulfatase activity
MSVVPPDDFHSDLDLGPTLQGLAAGQRLFGRYLLSRILGRGGMGVVWLAHDEELEIEVALKFLPDAINRDVEAVASLKRETRRGLRLSHPHILKTYGFLCDAQTAAIAMEFVDGKTLSALKVARGERAWFEVHEIKEWVRQICEGLDYAHNQAGLLHRDLKPINIMLSEEGEIKITDFGLAHVLQNSTRASSGFNIGGGTLPYMSPQQAASEEPTVADDIYSLGATLYDLLSGSPPFGGDASMIHLQLREVIPLPIGKRRSLPGGASVEREWEETIAACLEKDPARRPKSAKEVARRLGLRKEYQSEASPQIVERKIDARATNVFLRQHAGLLATALIILLVGGSWAAWWLGIERPRRQAKSYLLANQTKPKDVAETKRREVAVEAKAAAENAEKRSKAEEETATPTATPLNKEEQILKNIAGTTKEHPYENGLGMRFVPVPITGGTTSAMLVLFSLWETRVRDFAQFVEETRRDMETGKAAHTLEPSGGGFAWKQAGGDWRDPHFRGAGQQTDEHPVVCVSWKDAWAFCDWLTEREQNAGRLPRGWTYRLPSDHEWSCAVGLGGQEKPSQSPQIKDGKIKNVYPWGKQWPPPPGAGNYAGEESLDVTFGGAFWSVIEGYRDGAQRTSEVGRYQANEYGLYDLGGNVWEWCADKYSAVSDDRVMRGASWAFDESTSLLSSSRGYSGSFERFDDRGFRVVVAPVPSGR